MTPINTGTWAYSLDGLSFYGWAVVAQAGYSRDGQIVWVWPDWSIDARLAFDKAVDDGKVLKITGPAKSQIGLYWLYAKLAKYPKVRSRFEDRTPLTMKQVNMVQRRALPEFA